MRWQAIYTVEATSKSGPLPTPRRLLPSADRRGLFRHSVQNTQSVPSHTQKPGTPPYTVRRRAWRMAVPANEDQGKDAYYVLCTMHQGKLLVGFVRGTHTTMATPPSTHCAAAHQHGSQQGNSPRGLGLAAAVSYHACHFFRINLLRQSVVYRIQCSTSKAVVSPRPVHSLDRYREIPPIPIENPMWWSPATSVSWKLVGVEKLEKPRRRSGPSMLWREPWIVPSEAPRVLNAMRDDCVAILPVKPQRQSRTRVDRRCRHPLTRRRGQPLQRPVQITESCRCTVHRWRLAFCAVVLSGAADATLF